VSQVRQVIVGLNERVGRYVTVTSPRPMRCTPRPLVLDEGIGIDMRPFRLALGCAPFRYGLHSAIRSVPSLRSTPARRHPDRSANASSWRPPASNSEICGAMHRISCRRSAACGE